jgi:hypothetical protein
MDRRRTNDIRRLAPTGSVTGTTESLSEKFERLRQVAEEAEKQLPLSSTKDVAIKANVPLLPKEALSGDSIVKKDFERLLKRYGDVIEELESDRKKSKLADFKNKLGTLRSTYLHGLKRISQLKDLQSAPDALMPGNFPKKHTSTDDAETEKTNDNSAS